MEKYVQYVLSQVVEGNHTKVEVIDDLRERGLTEEEVNYVISRSWEEGKRLEKSSRSNFIVYVLSILIILLLITILLLINGSKLIEIHSFWMLLGGLVTIVIYVFRKKMFNK